MWQETTYNELSLLTQMKFDSASSPLRVTSYEYYPNNNRLHWIRSGPPEAPESEQKLEYSYDNVGMDYLLQRRKEELMTSQRCTSRWRLLTQRGGLTALILPWNLRKR